MTITDLLLSLGVWGGAAIIGTLARRRPHWPYRTPQTFVVSSLAVSHPYREHLVAVGPTAAQEQIDMADAAVKRERARIVAIAKAVHASSGEHGQRAAQAILDGIEGGL